MDETTDGMVNETTDENAATIESLARTIEGKFDELESSFDEKLESRISELAKPQRGGKGAEVVVDYVNRHGEKVAKLRNLSSYRYANLPENVRAVRDDESDHWMARWIVGMTLRRQNPELQTQVREAEGKLAEYFGVENEREIMHTGYERATTLEGTAPTTGALSDGTGAGLLPIPLAELVFIARDQQAISRRLFRSIPMAEQTRRITTVGAVTAAMAAEDAVAAQGEPTIATKVLIAKKAQARVKASIEELRDSAFDLVGVYAERAGEALGALLDTQIATSNGTAPNIQEAISGANVAEATSGTLIMEDIATLLMAVPRAYRANAVFLASGTMITEISNMQDANGRPQVLPQGLIPSVIADVGGTGVLFGRPVFEFPLATGTLLCCDPRAAYAIGDRQTLEVAMSEHVDFDNDRVVWKFTERWDGVNLDNGTGGGSHQIAGITTWA